MSGNADANCAPPDNCVLDYIYEHERTSATTGYFSCNPAWETDFWRDMELLEGRPLDSFLHQHLLRQIISFDSGEWMELADLCLKEQSGRTPGGNAGGAGRGHAALAALLLECLMLADNKRGGGLEAVRERLEKAAEPAFESSPLILRQCARQLGLREIRSWNDIFKANIYGHGELPEHAARKLGALWREEDVESICAGIIKDAGALERHYRESLALKPETVERAPAGETWSAALSALERAGLLEGPEMRHEASLSPIALLRQWRVRISVTGGNAPHRLNGLATAYGRGLSLAGARASCVMEIVERASAYASFAQSGPLREWQTTGATPPLRLLRATYAELREKGVMALNPGLLPARIPMEHAPLHWVEGEDSQGNAVLVPAQAVFLFCNLPEQSFFESSTGLAAGNTMAEARLAALMEILERDAHATTPFMRKNCFTLASHDRMIQALLNDYRDRGIIVQFQDITSEFGLPAFRCFVTGGDGLVAQATAANLDGRAAALAALTETPWPYVWAKPAPYGKPSGPGLKNLPVRFLESLPNLRLPSARANLDMLEKTLEEQGRGPVYVNISRSDLAFPVARAIIPGLELDAELDDASPVSPRLFARSRLLGLI